MALWISEATKRNASIGWQATLAETNEGCHAPLRDVGGERKRGASLGFAAHVAP
jgi:hypothetical protein